jgi:hypothetical protein
MNLLAMHTLFGPTAQRPAVDSQKKWWLFFARYTLCSKDFPDHYPEIAVGVQSKLSVWLMLFSVNPIPQLPGTPEGHNIPGFQHHLLTSCGVSSPSFMLFLDTKFAEATD